MLVIDELTNLLKHEKVRQTLKSLVKGKPKFKRIKKYSCVFRCGK